MTIINHQGELFHYRGREEFKDNNARAFTFCPTDEIRPLTQPQMPSVPQRNRLTQGMPIQPYAQVEATRPQHGAKFLAAQPAFTHQLPSTQHIFNEHMKSDLVSSRLRLGPSALRSAVDRNSASPTRTAGETGWGGLLFGHSNIPSTQPNFVRRFDNSSDMNPSASAFTPTKNVSSPSSDELGALNMSLCKALTNERDAHLATQAALENEIAGRREVEKEVTRLAMNNKSLIASVQMLGSIIKHNVEKTQPAKAAATDEHRKSQDNAKVQAEESLSLSKLLETSILHVALKRQHNQYETEGSTASPADGRKDRSLPAQSQAVAVNEEDLFNLNLLRSPDLNSDSEVSALSRTLRKHFLSASELTDAEKMPATLPRTTASSKLIIGLSPEEVRQMRGVQAVQANTAGKASSGSKKSEKPEEEIIMAPSRQAVSSIATASSKNMQPGTVEPAYHLRTYKLATLPQLRVPQSFVDKYRGPPERLTASSESTRAPSEPQNPPYTKVELQYRDPATVPVGSPSQRPANDSAKPKTQNGAVVPTTMSPKHPINVINMPFSPTIYWVIHRNNVVFDDKDDYDDSAKANYANNPRTRPMFWNHPIRFMPNLGEKNLYRTVMIDFIPFGATYHEVLQHIRTGPLESIQLYPSVGQSNDFMTARVVFHYELDARNLYVHDQRHGMIIKGKKVRVWQVLQPTYPKNQILEEAVFGDGAIRYTRILTLDNMSDKMCEMLPHKLQKQIDAGFVIEIRHSHDGLPQVEFTCVVEVMRAEEQLRADRNFMGIDFDCDTDPCMSGY